MERRKLGGTDLQVSPICLGTMQFGWTADEAASRAVMDAFYEAGGNFLDTADVYSNWTPGNPGGIAESLIGLWLRERANRAEMVIATKVRGRMWPGPDGEGLGRAHIMRAAEDSLRRLQIDTIDLYQCHHPDVQTPIEETLRAFEELIEAGKVRYIGLSNYTAAMVREALGVARKSGLPEIVSLQPRYNLVHRGEFEASLARVCERENIAVIPYSPLQGGFLTGKYRPDQPTPESPRAYSARQYANEDGWRAIEALDRVAQARETTVAAAAVAWLLAKPAVAAPIVGANNPQQLADILPAAGLRLTPDEVASLDAASARFA
jgi:aryl-alcohol dehydrogenase-like predicted oxidoreductase